MNPARNKPCPCGSGKKFKHCCEGKVASRASPLPAEIEPLVALYNTGRYAELENRASLLVDRYPGFGSGWTLLAGALQKQGKNVLPAYQKAAALMPGDAGAHYDLGVARQSSGLLAEAAESYRQALKIKPDYAEALYNLAYTLKQLGLIDAAAEHFRRVVEINPGFAEAHNNLGNILRDLGQPEEAEASYCRALESKPDYAEALNNLGTVLRDLGRLDDAVAILQRALEINPYFADAHSNLGTSLKELGRYDQAIASYRRALEINPDFAVAHFNLANSLLELGEYDKAMASYRRALEINPDFAVAHLNLSAVFRDLGQLDDAEKSCHRALEIKPDFVEAQAMQLFAMNYTQTPEFDLERARQFGRLVAGKVQARFASWQCTVHPERLRVGLVSGDLRKHSVGYFLEGLLAHIDPARIELIAYPTYHKEDELTARIRPCFLAWKPLVGKNDVAAARLIHADGVHVLIDLSGHTEHNRLPVFAWKPAPVQVTWLGLPTTTGVAEIDYVLGDPHAIPPEFESHFSEVVWRMPESYLCLAVPASPVNVDPLPALASGCVTFGSFNNLAKMNDAVVAVWSRILKSVPNSRLLLKTKQLGEPAVCEKTRQRFAACGIALERLILSGMLASRDEHLAAYNKVDLALDTFPYPGVTTSAEALWMGVPVLSLRGDRFLSRTAGSIAHNAGLPDWIAVDEDDYVAKAMAFTSDLERLAELRAGLRQKVLGSPLFDAPRFARNFEDALWGMWQSIQARQEKPS